jgi:hypothetical protein
MQRSKERASAPEEAPPESAAEATPLATPKAKRARRRKAPVTVPVSVEATADLHGAHLPSQPSSSQPSPSQSAASLRTLAAMHPQLRSASGSHAKPANPDAPPRQSGAAIAAPPPTMRAPRSTPVPVEETPDLALGRAWRYPIAPQPASSPLTSPRKGAPSRPQVLSKTQAALSALRQWSVNAPRPSVIAWAAIAQAALALLGALVFASLAVRGDSQALQALLFAALTGVPAGVAYILAARRATALLGALALVGSQIALFGWSFALVGPRPALLLLTPALIVVAMWMGGRTLGGGLAIGLGALYAFAALGSALAHRDLVTATLDLIAVVVGLTATCAALLALDRRAATAEAQAKTWQTEAERLDTLNQAQRARVEEEGSYLRATLAEALQGRGTVRVALEGPLARLTEMVYTVASRLLTLRRDRDERVRLEGALAQLMRAVEDALLGGNAQWPRQTGTPVDTLSDQLAGAPVWRAESHDGLVRQDFSAATLPTPEGGESNIRYLFPRASGSHPRGM